MDWNWWGIGEYYYKDTKLIKQHRKQLTSPFKELAEWVSKEFEGNVLNIYYDLIEGTNTPRLWVIFEYPHDAEKLRIEYNDLDKEKRTFVGWDKEKQSFVARKLQELTEQKGFYLRTENILVVFKSFEPIARAEANMSISIEKMQELKARVACENLWEISRFGPEVTFFFYTEEQARQNTVNGIKDKLAEEYCNLLKPYDEFNYFKKYNFSINIDSKENLGNNAKEFFMSMGCSHFHMSREYPERYEHYRLLKISQTMEAKWRQEKFERCIAEFPLDTPEKIGSSYNSLSHMINRDRYHLERMLILANEFRDNLPPDQIRLVLSVIIGNNGCLTHGGLIEDACKINLIDLAQRFVNVQKLTRRKKIILLFYG